MMKQFLLVAMLALFPLASKASEPNLFAAMKYCAGMSVNYAVLGTLARISKDEDEPSYKKYVLQQAAQFKDPEEAKELIFVGSIAWDNRKDVRPAVGAMYIYDRCVKDVGTGT